MGRRTRPAVGDPGRAVVLVMTRFAVRQIRRSDAVEFASYAYPEPYDLYDSAPGSEAGFLDPANRYASVVDASNALWGFCCFGPDARVPGGSYALASPALDVGVGMSPERTGQGAGSAFCASVLAHGAAVGATHFQVTVAAFNTRSLRVWAGLGFEERHRFEQPQTGRRFVQLVAQVPS